MARPRPAELLALLDNPDFRHDATALWAALASRWTPTALPTREDYAAALPGFLEEQVRPFIQTWGALPPPSTDLVEVDARRPAFRALTTGRWGLIPVFPWTTMGALTATARHIRRAIGRQHQDAGSARRAQLAIWLSVNDVPAREIARHVWSRRKGLRRPSRFQAIARVSPQREEELMRRFRARGLTYRTAERRVLRGLRGSEAPACAAVRVAVARYRQERRAFNAALKTPGEREPAAFAVTMLLRAALLTEDLSEMRRWAQALRDALLGPTGPAGA